MPCLHVNDKFRVGVREASELILVQVHDEEFVGGRELHRLPGELFVEVGSVAFVLLELCPKLLASWLLPKTMNSP